MPLGPEYDKLIDSQFADMKNTGGRHAGSITAAQFLQRFVNDTPWAHLDIAGTAMGSPKTDINQSWGSGWGVRLLDRLVARSLRSSIARGTTAMTEVLFYHLQTSSLESVLPPLLEKSLERGWRVVVQSTARKSAPMRSMRICGPIATICFCRTLPGAWRCAGSADRADGGGRQPEQRQCPVSDRQCRVARRTPAGYERMVLVFNGDDDDALAPARARLDRQQGAGIRGHLLADRRTGTLAAAGIACRSGLMIIWLVGRRAGMAMLVPQSDGGTSAQGSGVGIRVDRARQATLSRRALLVAVCWRPAGRRLFRRGRHVLVDLRRRMPNGSRGPGRLFIKNISIETPPLTPTSR